MNKSEFSGLLHNKNFLLLWANQILTQLAYNFINFSLLFLVYQLTKSNLASALLILTIIIPTAFFSVFTGVLSDFFDRRKIMILVNTVWAVLVLGFIFIQDEVLAILTLSFLINTVDRFFTPAQLAALPMVVKNNQLLMANSLFSISLNATFILGVTLAGPLMLLLGNTSVFIIASVFAFTAAFCVWFLPKMKTNGSKKSALKLVLDDTFSAIKQGYEFIFEKRIILSAIIFLTIIQSCVNIGSALGPGYAENILKVDVRHASILFALPVGLGSALGIYILNRWQGKVLKRTMVGRGMVICLFAILALGIGPVISDLALSATAGIPLSRPISHILSLSGVTIITAFFLGLAFSFIFIPPTTILSENTPKELRGRVWGVMGMFQNAIASIPLVVFGFIADKISILPLTFIFAIVLLFLYNLTKKKSLEGFFYG